MNISEAERIYKHPNGHTRDELTECLHILNALPRRLSAVEQAVITDAKDRLDILNDVISITDYEVK